MIATNTTDNAQDRLDALYREQDEVTRQLEAAFFTRSVGEFRGLARRAHRLDAAIQDLRWTVAITTTFGRQA